VPPTATRIACEQCSHVYPQLECISRASRCAPLSDARCPRRGSGRVTVRRCLTYLTHAPPARPGFACTCCCQTMPDISLMRHRHGPALHAPVVGRRCQLSACRFAVRLRWAVPRLAPAHPVTTHWDIDVCLDGASFSPCPATHTLCCRHSACYLMRSTGGSKGLERRRRQHWDAEWSRMQRSGPSR